MKNNKCYCGNKLYRVTDQIVYCYGCGDSPAMCKILKNCKGNEPDHPMFLYE